MVHVPTSVRISITAEPAVLLRALADYLLVAVECVRTY